MTRFHVLNTRYFKSILAKNIADDLDEISCSSAVRASPGLLAKFTELKKKCKNKKHFLSSWIDDAISIFTYGMILPIFDDPYIRLSKKEVLRLLIETKIYLKSMPKDDIEAQEAIKKIDKFIEKYKLFSSYIIF